MSAYVIVDIDVTDPRGYEAYKQAAPTAVGLFGGTYLARGGRTEVLEGEWRPDRIVIPAFESAERARPWLDSAEYAPARKQRHATARSNVIVVEGL
ncbi:MAG TPA: DUF1330 domain-containing protein [Anaerolineales bacterium]